MSDVIRKHSISNEQIVLACLMQNNETLYKNIRKVKVTYFINERNKNTIKILYKLVNNKLKFNLDTLLEIAQNLDIGKKEYLQKLIETFEESLPNIDYHINQLALNFAKLRTYNEALNNLDEILLNPKSEKQDIEEILKSISEEFKICSSNSKIKKGDEIVNNYKSSIENRLSGNAFGTTGIKQLDDCLVEGFVDGKVTIIGAVTSMGKTTFTTNIVNGLFKKNKKVAWFALEPQINSLTDMLLANRLDIPLKELIKETDKLTKDDLLNIEDEIKYLFKDNDLIHFWDDPTANLSVMEEILSNDNYNLAIVDLFEKFSDIDSGDSKILTQKLDELQTIAKVTNTHIVVIQQLSRDIAKRKNKRPVLTDFSNSKKYEEVADNVFFLHREKYYNNDLEDDIFEVIVAKQRTGPRDFTVSFKFEPEYSRISNLLDFNINKSKARQDT